MKLPTAHDVYFFGLFLTAVAAILIFAKLVGLVDNEDWDKAAEWIGFFGLVLALGPSIFEAWCNRREKRPPERRPDPDDGK